MTKKEYKELNQIYDCVVIGSGPSSEPVVFHLSKSGLRTLIVDSSDINSNYDLIENSKLSLSRLTPKQKFSDLKIKNKKITSYLFSNSKISTFNFNYLYGFVSGGLSNFWGGGLFEWDDDELEKTTTIRTNLIRSSYKSIRQRLLCGPLANFFGKTSFANSFLKDNVISNKFKFKISEFFLNPIGIKNNHMLRNEFDQHLIWNSAETIKKYIKSSDNIFYSSNSQVNSIAESDNIKVLNCKSKKGYFQIKTKAIFLCAGTINSTCLAFSALNLKNENFELKHTTVAIAPMISFSKAHMVNRKNISLPEVIWTYSNENDGIPDTAGYIISSAFLYKRLERLFKNKFIQIFNPLISRIISRISFVTIYRKNINFRTNFNITLKAKEKNKQNFYDLKITTNPTKINLFSKCIRNFIVFNNQIKNKWQIFFPLIRLVRNGGDVHYASTMPQKELNKSPITTNKFGEINNLKNIFVCDPSRLSHLSVLPHTFTSMAISDASLPFIIRKLKKEFL